jgi:hypothetical protein
MTTEEEELQRAKGHVRALISLLGELAGRDQSYMGDPRFLSALTYVADEMGKAADAEIEVSLRSWNCSTCGAEGESDPLQVPLYCHDCMTKPDEGKWVEVTWATEDLEAENERV